jgi:TatD DNase family protein
LLDLGLSIAVNGIATFPLRKTQRPEEAIDRTIERIPLDRLLLETDAPYLAPAPHRGKRNEPAFVEEVAKHVAAVRKVGLEAVARRTVENTATLFRLPV